MSQFLWIEDFDEDAKQSFTQSVFGKFLDNAPIPYDDMELKVMKRYYSNSRSYKKCGKINNLKK